MSVDPEVPKEVDKKVRSVVAYLTYSSPYPLNATRIMKLAYLAELTALERLGRRLTNAEFRSWNYGPYSWDVALAMEGMPELRVQLKATPKGEGKFFVPTQDKAKVFLSKEETRLLDEVVGNWLRVPNDKLIAATKRTPPYVWAKFRDPIPFERYKEFASWMRKAETDRMGKVVELDGEAAIDEFVRSITT